MTASTDHTYEEALQSLHFAAANADVPDAQLFGTLVTARAGRNELSLLGLSPDQFTGLLARQFPHLRSVDTIALTSAVAPLPLPATHAAFVATLHARLMDDANPAIARDDADCLAAIIAHACLRPDHLWRDLGLDGRDAVSAMLARFFPGARRAQRRSSALEEIPRAGSGRIARRAARARTRMSGLRGFRFLLSSCVTGIAATGGPISVSSHRRQEKPR